MIRISEDHVYTDSDGIVLPSVSEIIRKSGLMPNYSRISGFYADRGKLIHEDISKKHFLGIEPSGETEEYLEKFQNFLDDTGAKIIYSELRGEATLNGVRYAGTMDLVVTINGVISIVDIKSGALAKWHGIQLNGYHPIALQSYDICADKLFGLSLKGPKYRLKEYKINDSFKDILK